MTEKNMTISPEADNKIFVLGKECGKNQTLSKVKQIIEERIEEIKVDIGRGMNDDGLYELKDLLEKIKGVE